MSGYKFGILKELLAIQTESSDKTEYWSTENGSIVHLEGRAGLSLGTMTYPHKRLGQPGDKVVEKRGKVCFPHGMEMDAYPIPENYPDELIVFVPVKDWENNPPLRSQ